MAFNCGAMSSLRRPRVLHSLLKAWVMGDPLLGGSARNDDGSILQVAITNVSNEGLDSRDGRDGRCRHDRWCGRG